MPLPSYLRQWISRLQAEVARLFGTPTAPGDSTIMPPSDSTIMSFVDQTRALLNDIAAWDDGEQVNRREYTTIDPAAVPAERGTGLLSRVIAERKNALAAQGAEAPFPPHIVLYLRIARSALEALPEPEKAALKGVLVRGSQARTDKLVHAGLMTVLNRAVLASADRDKVQVSLREIGTDDQVEISRQLDMERNNLRVQEERLAREKREAAEYNLNMLTLTVAMQTELYLQGYRDGRDGKPPHSTHRVERGRRLIS